MKWKGGRRGGNVEDRRGEVAHPQVGMTVGAVDPSFGNGRFRPSTTDGTAPMRRRQFRMAPPYNGPQVR